MACLLFHLLIGLTILTNTTSQAENDFGSCSSEIELTIELREQHHEITYNVYCKSRTKPFDDSAEFQVDGYSQEHIVIIKNRCFNNFVPHECNVKVLGSTTDITNTTTDITNTTSNSSSPSDDIGHNTNNSLTIYLLILFSAVVTIILLLTFLVKWFKRSKTEVRSKTIDPETLPLTENRTQMLLEKIEVVDHFVIIDCESDIIYCGNFCEEQRCKHEQGQAIQHEQILRNERILDMGFVEHNNELCLVYIDADNKKIVRQNFISEKDRKEFLLKKQPNRLSKINDETVAVIYKKELEVLIFNVKEMKEEKTIKMSKQHILDSSNGIQGILALSENNFILSDKMHLCVLKMNENGPIVKKLDLQNKVEFDTARRLTHAFASDGKKDIIFIADENDKRITSITIPPQNEEKESIAGHLIMQQMDHNRGLQNVRAIVATQSRIYAATSAGICVFRHNIGYFDKCVDQSSFGKNSKDYKMLVEYNKHVEHTRSLCIHTSREYIYIALSCVIKQQDVILVFKLKPNIFFK